MSRDQAEVVAFCQAVTSKMLNHVNAKYSIKGLVPIVRHDFSARRKTSWGGIKSSGQGFMTLALLKWNKSSTMNFREYAHIAKSPEIGAVKGDWKLMIATLIAHELAHVVQHFRFGKSKLETAKMYSLDMDWPSQDLSGHGELWQLVYKDLRVNFVNNRDYEKLDYTFTPTQAPAPSTQPAQPARKVTKAYYTKEINANGGRHAIYYRTSDNTVIGRLFKREGGKVQFSVGMDKYTWTSFYSNAMARKALIETLI